MLKFKCKVWISSYNIIILLLLFLWGRGLYNKLYSQIDKNSGWIDRLVFNHTSASHIHEENDISYRWWQNRHVDGYFNCYRRKRGYEGWNIFALSLLIRCKLYFTCKECGILQPKATGPLRLLIMITFWVFLQTLPNYIWRWPVE